jgi:hypothetical protein
MEFFTVLVFSYVVDGEPIDLPLVTASEWECSDALKAAAPLSDVLKADMFCRVSDIPSSSIRPKLRPEKEE